MRSALLCLMALGLAQETLAAKKDFKGLFGSYRREKFTENEGNLSDVGMDLMLSTLLPLSTVVTSTASTPTAAQGLYYSTFFNLEGTFFFTMSYNWELFANLGYYSYDTRKLNEGTTQGTGARYHVVKIDIAPITLGAKYRFGTSDIVPYVGAGIGAAYVKRYTEHTSSNLSNTLYNWALTAQVLGGVEFFISPNTGIRLEAAVSYLGLSAHTYDAPGAASTNPTIYYQANPIAVRYASGVFFLF
ncbi:porin family protein [bacterium]|nr:porin family protein [bacterium]